MSSRTALTKKQWTLIAQLWITSVAGTALVIFIQAIGQDWSNWQFFTTVGFQNIEWAFTFDRAVRYLFAIWFSIYLILAYLANEARPDPSRSGVLFDIFQSIFVFAALGTLGFVTQNFRVFEGDEYFGLFVAFGTIAFIAVVTLVRHVIADRRQQSTHSADDELEPMTEERLNKLQLVRLVVAAIAVAAAIYECVGGPRKIANGADWIWTIVFAIAMYGGLVAYFVFAFKAKKTAGS